MDFKQAPDRFEHIVFDRATVKTRLRHQCRIVESG